MAIRKSESFEFTKLQKRLLRTVQEKHTQAMNIELNTVLTEIYEEMGYDPETDDRRFSLRRDLSGLDLVVPIKEEKIDA